MQSLSCLLPGPWFSQNTPTLASQQPQVGAAPKQPGCTLQLRRSQPSRNDNGRNNTAPLKTVSSNLHGCLPLSTNFLEHLCHRHVCLPSSTTSLEHLCHVTRAHWVR